MSRRTTIQLSSVTTSMTDSLQARGPTVSVNLNSNIYLDTTGATVPGIRRTIYIPTPRITAKFSPPSNYAVYQDWKDFYGYPNAGAGHVFPAGTTSYGSTASKIFNAPPTVYLSWMGTTGGYSSSFLDYNPEYLLYYYSSAWTNGATGAGTSQKKHKNPRRKWKHPLNYAALNALINAALSGATRPYNNSPARITEWQVPTDGSPTLISALNYGTGASYSWNDGFHPSQYLAVQPSMEAIAALPPSFGSSHNFPVGVTATLDDLFGWTGASGQSSRLFRWGANKNSNYVKSKYAPYIGKQPSLFFRFRIRITHPDGQYMYGPFSETLVIKPRIGLFQGQNLPGPFYCFYGWNLKVK